VNAVLYVHAHTHCIAELSEGDKNKLILSSKNAQ